MIRLIILLLIPLNLIASAGNNSLSVLAMDFDPTTAAQGNAMIASVNDINSIFINPAGLGFLKWQGLKITYSSLWFDMSFNNACIAFPIFYGTVGLNLGYLHAESVDELDKWSRTGKKLDFYDMIASLNYGNEIDFYRGILSFGAGLKFVHEQLGHTSGKAFLVDLGAQYRFNLFNLDLMNRKEPNFGAGLVIKNLGQGIKYDDDVWQFVPTVLGLGIFYRPLRYYRIEIDLESHREASYRLKIGNEFYFTRYFIPRLGYIIEEKASGLSFGAGLFYFFNKYRLSFDYTQRLDPDLGNHHFLGLTLYKTGAMGSGMIDKKILLRKEGVDRRKSYPKGLKIGVINIVNTIIDETLEEYMKLFPTLLNNFLKDSEDKNMTVVDRDRILGIFKSANITPSQYNTQRSLKALSEWIDIDLVLYGYTLVLNGERQLKIELIDVKTLEIVSIDFFPLTYEDELELIEKVIDKLKIRIGQLTEQ
ncbi:MAG: PorV/PorQ family protein [Spirochaetes bacterium]|nr:PorV/PorQ family protein [Spirochaetota bacterium]